MASSRIELTLSIFQLSIGAFPTELRCRIEMTRTESNARKTVSIFDDR